MWHPNADTRLPYNLGSVCVFTYGHGFSSFFSFLTITTVPSLHTTIQEQGRTQTLHGQGWVGNMPLGRFSAPFFLTGSPEPRGLLETAATAFPGDTLHRQYRKLSHASPAGWGRAARKTTGNRGVPSKWSFKTNKYTNNRLNQMQQEILCENQAMRLPCPEHTTSSVHLLTEDGETEAADCVQDRRGPLVTRGHGQGAEVKEAIMSTSLQTQVSTHRRPKATAARPFRTLGNSVWGGAAEFPCLEESSCLPTNLALVSS